VVNTIVEAVTMDNGVVVMIGGSSFPEMLKAKLEMRGCPAGVACR